jgi:hypothetical protein
VDETHVKWVKAPGESNNTFVPNFFFFLCTVYQNNSLPHCYITVLNKTPPPIPKAHYSQSILEIKTALKSYRHNMLLQQKREKETLRFYIFIVNFLAIHSPTLGIKNLKLCTFVYLNYNFDYPNSQIFKG